MVKIKNTFGISKKSFNLLLESLKKYNEIEKAVIFGSRAMGNEKRGSDIDIAVYGSNVNQDIVRELIILLNEKYNIPYFIDVIWFNDITNLELKKHIRKEGKVIFNRQKAKIIKPKKFVG